MTLITIITNKFLAYLRLLTYISTLPANQVEFSSSKFFQAGKLVEIYVGSPALLIEVCRGFRPRCFLTQNTTI
jgi:hypothetical protein